MERIVVEAIPVTVVRRGRGCKLRISVLSEYHVEVVASHRWSEDSIRQFVSAKAAWVRKWIAWHRTEARRFDTSGVAQTSYTACKARAHRYVRERIAILNASYCHSITAIRVKNHSRQWGSCSRRGILNFNYRILFLPTELADYIMVHEICHLREMNHSERFWALVAQAVPDHQSRRKELRKYVL